MSNGTLFDDTIAGGAPERTYGVNELNESIARSIARAFPDEVWVTGEIASFGRTRGRQHRYFELVEKESGANRIKATLPVALLGWNADRVEADLAQAPGLMIDDGIEVRIRGRLGYFSRFGRLSIEMTGIDATFTMGRMAAARARILDRLERKGLLDKNGALDVSLLPLHIGVITSIDSAARHDFVHELSASGIGFHVDVIDARMQGRDTDATVLSALRLFRHMKPDVVAIVRGGGSRSDLAWFDSEPLARMIADMPIPIFTGIGHEIDDSVVDRVAHSSFKTPTAVAAAIVARVSKQRGRIEAAAVELCSRSNRIISAVDAHLSSAGHRLYEATRSGLDIAALNIDRKTYSLVSVARRSLETAGHRLDLATVRVDARDPAATLARGFTLTHDATGATVTAASTVCKGDALTTYFADGVVESIAASIVLEPETMSPKP